MKKLNLALLAVFAILAALAAACAFTPEVKTYKLTYIAEEGGRIVGNAEQYVEIDCDGEEVTAVPNDGYEFIGWNDGQPREFRTETKVNSDRLYIARFRRISCQAEYSATEGGMVKGIQNQACFIGGDLQTVTAVADEGYYFVQWSDGVTTADRTDKNVTADLYVSAIFERNPVTVKYVSGEHGTITGATEQTVKYGGEGKRVVAIPDEGYELDCWSDGGSELARFETGVEQDITLTVFFKKIEREFILNYNGYGDLNVLDMKIMLTYDELSQTKLPALSKEHFTFHGWYMNDTKFGDEQGNILVGNEIFKSEEREIKVKMTADENFTYKVLFVYPTEIDAQLPGKYKDLVDVKYKVTEEEIEVYHMFTQKFKLYLETMMDGLLTVEVDEIFITRPMLTNDFKVNNNPNLGYYSCNALYAYQIAELKKANIFNEYGSVITVLNMGGAMGSYLENAVLDTAAGVALVSAIPEKGPAYACVFFDLNLKVGVEGFFTEDYYSNISLLLKNDLRPWVCLMEVTIHEFAHTVENKFKYIEFGAENVGEFGYLLDYHYATSTLTPTQIGISKLSGMGYGTEIDFDKTKRFFLNEVYYNGESFGVPYGVWIYGIVER